jgi:TonB family protein
MQAKVQGETSVQCTIRSDGRNTNCRVLKGLPYLDSAVIRAVEAARSEPIRVNGRAVDHSDHIWHITIKLREIVDDRTSARGLPNLNWN